MPERERKREQSGFAGYYLLFATLYGGYGALSPFLPAFLKERGLDAEEIARLLAAAMLVRLVAGPLAGRFADRSGAARGLLALCLALSGVLTLAFLPWSGVLPLLAIGLVQAAATAPLAPLADTLALGAASGSALSYGRVRATGSAAFIAATIVTGTLVAATGSAAGLCVGAGLFALAALAAMRLAKAPSIPCSEQSPHPEVPAPAGLEGALQGSPRVPEPSFEGAASRRHLGMRTRVGSGVTVAGFRVLAANARYRRLLFCAGLVIGAHAMHDAFAVIVWREAGLSAGVAGWLWSESVAAEILVFLWLGPRLIARIGPARTIQLAALAGALRWAVQAATAGLPALAAVQCLHGLTFAALHLACLAVIGQSVPDGLRATALAVYGAALGLVTAGVTLAAGSLYAAYGAPAFAAMALLSLAALPVAWPLRIAVEGVHSTQQTST